MILACGMVIPGLAQAGKRYPELVEEVRHQLVMLPYYGVFDNLEFRIDGDTVVLSGQVTTPTLKSDAERVVKRLESVSKVVNNIEVLPVGGHDQDIRLATYRAIYSKPGLDRYALRAVPPIREIRTWPG
jgi:hyperosmotically inducible protein